MAAKTYTPVQSDYKFIAIIEYLLQQTGPVNATQIAKALEMALGTVMSHVTVALDCKWIKEVNGNYEPGLRLMGMYSAYKMGLVAERDQIERKLALLEA